MDSTTAFWTINGIIQALSAIIGFLLVGMVFYFNQMKTIISNKKLTYEWITVTGYFLFGLGTIIVGLQFLSNSIALTSQLPGDGQILTQEIESSVGELIANFGLFLDLVGILAIAWVLICIFGPARLPRLKDLKNP